MEMNLYKVNGALAKYFYCNTLACAYMLFKANKLIPENIMNIDIKEDIPARLLPSAKNICTSCITAFLEFILKPLSAKLLQKMAETNVKIALWNYWRLAQLERPPNWNSRNWKTTTSALHCGSRWRDTNIVTKALECEWEKHSNFKTKANKIIELKKLSLDFVDTQYGD